MRVLLDTHALIWYVDQDHLLGASAHQAMTAASTQIYVSAASIWEVGIKLSLGKLTLARPFSQWMLQAISDL
jgi:PIN domain nuclease of toxin-antitoxin system